MIKTLNIRKVAFVFVLALMLVSFFGITNKAQAAVTQSGIIYDGNGEVTKTLLNGKSAKITLDGSVIDINVGGEKYGYYSTICVGTCVISDDDLLHIFWHTGDYYVYDLYESGRYILAGYTGVKGYQVNYYAVSSTEDANIVKGSSAANASFHSCIIDSKYFYMYGKTGKKLLMTRKEFERIVDGEDPEPTPVPTAVSTQEPTAVPTATPSNNNCGCKDGGKCTCPAGQCKCDNCNCGPTASCQPTAVPTQEPTAVPTATPSNNNCGCKDGKQCTCPAGQCKCDNCNCGPTVSCHPTQKPTVAPTKKPGNNANNSEINVPGNNNTINVNQNISITDTTTNVIGDGNNVGVSVNGGKAANSTTKKKKKTTTKVSAKKHARVVTSGKRIKLFTKKNKLHGWLIFNKKTGSLNWNGYHMKGVKTCGFIQKSWNVIVVMKNGTVYKLPKTVKAGKTVHKTRIKCSEAKTLNRDSYGFVKYVKLKCGGVKNVSGK